MMPRRPFWAISTARICILWRAVPMAGLCGDLPACRPKTRTAKRPSGWRAMRPQAVSLCHSPRLATRIYACWSTADRPPIGWRAIFLRWNRLRRTRVTIWARSHPGIIRREIRSRISRATRQLVSLAVLAAHPLLLTADVARRARVSRITAERVLARLQDMGLIREATGAIRFRLWAAKLR